MSARHLPPFPWARPGSCSSGSPATASNGPTRRLLIAHPLYPLCATGSPHLAGASIRGRYAHFASCSTAGLPMMTLLIPEEGSQSARHRCDEVPCTQLSPASMGQAVPGEAVGLSSDVEEPVRGEAAAPRRARAQELLMSGPETCKRAGPAALDFVCQTLRAFCNPALARPILLNLR